MGRKRLQIKNTTIVFEKDIFGKTFIIGAFRSKPGRPSFSVATHRRLEDLPKTNTIKQMLVQIKKFLKGKKLINK